MRPRLQRTDAAAQQVTDALLEDARNRRRRRRGRLQPAHPDAEHQYRVLLRLAQAVGACANRKQEQIEAIQASVQRQLGGVSDGLAFSFPPPAIPGIGTSGGVTMILQDRSGNDDPTFLTKNLFGFLGALSKRPEIAAAIPSYLPAVPQLYADVDREKASQQQVDLNNIYTTMQTFMGGYLVNYFNRFGRQWQTYVEAEGDTRTQHPEHQPVLCAQRQRQPGAAGLAGARAADHRAGVHPALQRVQRRAVQHHRRARLQLRPGARRAGRGLSRRPCRRAWASPTRA